MYKALTNPLREVCLQIPIDFTERSYYPLSQLPTDKNVLYLLAFPLEPALQYGWTCQEHLASSAISTRLIKARYSSGKAMSILYRIAFYTDIKCSLVQNERQRNRTGTSWSHTSIFVPKRMAVQSKDKPPLQNRVDPTILQLFSLTHRHLSINTDIFCQSQMCPSERIDCSLCVSLKFILLGIKLRRRTSSSPPPHRSCNRERVPFDALVLMSEQRPYPVW